MRYVASNCRNEIPILQDLLDQIAAQNGRVISVLWQADTLIPSGNLRQNTGPSYTVISEFADAHRT